MTCKEQAKELIEKYSQKEAVSICDKKLNEIARSRDALLPRIHNTMYWEAVKKIVSAVTPNEVQK